MEQVDRNPGLNAHAGMPCCPCHGIEVLDQPDEASAVEGLEHRLGGLPAWQRALLVGHDHENLRRSLCIRLSNYSIPTRSSCAPFGKCRLEKVVLGLKKPESRSNSSFRKMALLINRGNTAMTDLASFLPNAVRREPWNKGKLIGPKPPLRRKHVWSIRTELQIDGRLIWRLIANCEDVTLSR